MEQAKWRKWLEEIMEARGGKVPEIPQELVPVLQALFEEWTAERQKRIGAEETLAFFKASADAMPNPIFMKDDDLRFVFFNRAYRSFFGLVEGENLGKRVLDLTYLPQEERERYHDEDSEMLRALSVIQYDVAYQAADRGEVEALYWSEGFLVPETGRRGLIGEIVDITKERSAERPCTEHAHAGAADARRQGRVQHRPADEAVQPEYSGRGSPYEAKKSGKNRAAAKA